MGHFYVSIYLTLSIGDNLWCNSSICVGLDQLCQFWHDIFTVSCKIRGFKCVFNLNYAQLGKIIFVRMVSHHMRHLEILITCFYSTSQNLIPHFFQKKISKLFALGKNYLNFNISDTNFDQKTMITPNLTLIYIVFWLNLINFIEIYKIIAN